MDSVLQLPSSVQPLFLAFVGWAFSNQNLANFTALVTGWILAGGRHTISAAIRSSPFGGLKHHSAIYRLLSRAVWCVDAVGFVVLQLIEPYLKGRTLLAIVDDTLSAKSGPQIWGGGMHHDACLSTYGRGGRAAYKAFSFGLNFVILAIWVPLPWLPSRGVALPVLFRLYRAKKSSPAKDYRKRTELAVEMLALLNEWMTEVCSGKQVVVTGDGEYSCQTLLKRMPPAFEYVGPMCMAAALYGPPPSRKAGRGRPRKVGERLPSPVAMSRDDTVPWRTGTFLLYGRKVKIRFKSLTCLWPTVCGTRPVRVIVTRDPRGRFEDRAYFSTLWQASEKTILALYARRWSLEVTFYNAKQFLGLEHPQNGWGKRKERPEKDPPGPRPQGDKGRLAAERTVPLLFLAHNIVYLWYFRHGRPADDVAWVLRLCPWYRQKTRPSYRDMLRALRLELILGRISAHPRLKRIARYFPQLFAEGILGA